MSELNQLPMMFKLYQEGEHVGYEKHEVKKTEFTLRVQQIETDIITQKKIFNKQMIISQGIDGKNWIEILSNKSNGSFWICHDEKHQSTGLTDANGEEIYFGDKLCNVRNRDNPPTVAINEKGEIIARWTGGRVAYEAIYFKDMELVK